MKKKDTNPHRRLLPPFRIEERKQGERVKEAYLMANGSYVVTHTEKQSKEYAKTMKRLKKECEEGNVTTVSAARAWLKNNAV